MSRPLTSDAVELDYLDVLRLARALILDQLDGATVAALAAELTIDPDELRAFGREWAEHEHDRSGAPSVRSARAQVVATLRGETPC